MKAKKVAILMIGILMICIIIVLCTIFFLIRKRADIIPENDVNIVNDLKTNEILDNEIVNNDEVIDENLENEIGTDSDYDNLTDEEKAILKREGILISADEIDENGNIKFTDDEINNFQFEIEGLSAEILQYIKNVDDLKFQIKKYIYSNPELTYLTKATVSYYKFQDQDSILSIYFNLDDNLRMIVVSINLEDNSVTVNDFFKD